MRFAGGEELARQLEKLPKALSDQLLLAALKKAAEPMRADAQSKAPRLTGRLADNMTIQKATRIGSVEGGRWRTAEGSVWVAVGPHKGTYWGIFQEFGTVHHRAQPFLRPAFDANGARALNIIRDELWNGIHRNIDFSMGSSLGRVA